MDTPINAQALPAGTRLEEFVIESILGSGGFGVTYLARDTSLGRQVVIKENLPAQFCFRDTHSLTVAPRHTTGEDAENFRWSLENFSKEAAMLASLNHPGIVKVLRSFQSFGTAYFVMPFVEGIAFDALIDSRSAKRQTFSEEELGGLLHRMLSALGYLHERGIYHRDIKPGNILITNEGVPLLIDFGSARQRLSERSMTVVESAGYTPFEQLQSRGNVGPWSDLYALGGTLVKALTGEAPPKAMDRMRKDPHQPLAERVELLSQFTQEFLHGIDQSLEVDEECRWQNAGEWLAGLQEKDPAEPAPPETPPRAETPSHPKPPPSGNVPRRIERPSQFPAKPPVKKVKPLPWIIATAICVILVLVTSAIMYNASTQREQAMTIVAALREQVGQQQQRLANERAVRQEQVSQEAAANVAAEQQRAAEAAAKAEQQRLAEAKPKVVNISTATRTQPFVNSLGMKFVPVKITGGPSAGQEVLFSMWETRVQDYRQYAEAKSGVDGEWTRPGFRQGEDHPVVKVSWDDAVAFCAWLTGQERSAGRISATAKYRLPTDHEWSCAVGIGAREDANATPASKDDKIGGVFPWGTQWPPPMNAGNYGEDLKVDSYAHTSPVGSFAANGYGLYDMGGNVLQWCEDSYNQGGAWHVLRGAWWGDYISWNLRTSYRHSFPPSYRGGGSSFRIVLLSRP
jgi:serine/threonine protein kinase/formylglycine-generating enzyme required for sulfatase activity